MRTITFREAINEALFEEMENNDKIFIMGEDVGRAGGIRGVTQNLQATYGVDRVFDTPLSEEGIAGAGVGAAIIGLRPIVEIMYADFLPICMDEVVNKAGKWRYSHGGGGLSMAMVFRVSTGGGFGGGSEHSQSLESWFVHAPGLITVHPSSPHDAKGLLKSAIRDENPVLFFEHRMLFNEKGPVPENDYTVPLGKAEVLKEGSDITIVGYGYILKKAMSCMSDLEEEGISVELIDLRTIKPLDEDTILQSVEKTGRLLTIEEGVKNGGVGAEISAVVAEKGLFSLHAPVKRLGALDIPIPYSPTLEKHVLPTDENKIKKAIKEAFEEE